MLEFDFRLYDENKRPIEIDSRCLDGPAWPTWLSLVRNVATRAGGNIDAAFHLHAWVKDHPMFDDVVGREVYMPACPWLRDGGFWDHIGGGLRDDVLSFISSSRPMLLGSGIPEEMLYRLAQRARHELENNTGRYYARAQLVYARKRPAWPHPP